LAYIPITSTSDPTLQITTSNFSSFSLNPKPQSKMASFTTIVEQRNQPWRSMISVEEKVQVSKVGGMRLLGNHASAHA
jgi:hypothetical protein